MSKPKKMWHWLALFSPGATSVAFTAFGKLFLSEDNQIAPSLLGLPVAFIMCVVIAFLLARRTGGVGKVLGSTLLFTLGLVFVNFFIAFGGCAVLQPKFRME